MRANDVRDVQSLSEFGELDVGSGPHAVQVKHVGVFEDGFADVEAFLRDELEWFVAFALIQRLASQLCDAVLHGDAHARDFASFVADRFARLGALAQPDGIGQVVIAAVQKRDPMAQMGEHGAQERDGVDDATIAAAHPLEELNDAERQGGRIITTGECS